MRLSPASQDIMYVNYLGQCLAHRKKYSNSIPFPKPHPDPEIPTYSKTFTECLPWARYYGRHQEFKMSNTCSILFKLIKSSEMKGEKNY